MTSSTITFIRLVTKILLSMVVLKLVTVAAIEGNFRLLYGESKDLLYYETSHHQWHLCNINHTEVNLYEYNKNGYISVDCYRQNYKKTGNLKYAIFMTGSGDKRLGPPMCPPLKSGESYDWRCEKDMLSSAVTPYRNCTSVCKEGFYTVNHVTVRCSFTLDWIWFGDVKTPRCESGSPSTKVIPSTPNGPVYTPTTMLITDFNWILKNLTSLPLNSTSTRLTWMVSPLHNENPFPRRYRLSYRVRGETTHKEIILNGSSVNHTLTNLQKETDYDIKLCALGNQDKKKFCINTTTHINADKPVTQHSETNSKEYAGIIGGSIAGAGLIFLVFLAMYCYCKKNRSRDHYTAVSGGLSSSSSRSSQCSSGRYSCCLQVLIGKISRDNGPTEGTSESTETGTSSYEDKNENNNASSSNMTRENVILVLGKDTDKEKKHVDSGREMCPIDSENNKEQLEDLSSEFSENKNSGKTDVSQPADSGGETCPIHLQKNERQLEDASSEFSENENSRKTEESQPVDSGGEMCPIDSQMNEKQLEDVSAEFSENENSGKTEESKTVDSGGEICKIDSEKNENQSSYLSSECSKYKNSRKNEKSQPVDSGSDGSFKNDNSSMDKEGDSLALESAPSLSSLFGESSGYASGIQTMSFDLNRDDNRSHDTENIGGSSVSNNMVAMEHIPGPSSIQEYGDDHMNQLSYGAQGVNPIVKPDSFDFNRDQDESFDQYHSIGQVACEQETYCDQQFPRDQRSSSPSGITHSDPGHVGRSQSSTFVDILQNEETFSLVDGVDANITNTYKKKKECIQDVAENAQLRGHQFDSEEYSNQRTPCCSMNSEEDIDRRHPARLPTHECQEPCIDYDCPTNNAQIYTYPASSEKEDKVQSSSRCQSLSLVIPQSNATNGNIQRSGTASTMCTLSVEKAIKEEHSSEFFQKLAYQLDPDSFYGNAKSWYGLTLVVLHLSEEKVKSMRHHTMGNIERGHFHATLEAYIAEHKFMSDIVKYFVQPSSLRPDVIQFIKQYHTDCPVCNALYPQVNISMSQSTQEIIKISTDHHENNS